MDRRKAITVLNTYKDSTSYADLKEACGVAISELERYNHVIAENIELTDICTKLTHILSEINDKQKREK